jgi:hypothetical protein
VPEPGELSAQDRHELRRAHERLRAASQELQALIATEPIKNRWAPEPAPPEILEAAKASYDEAVERVAARQRAILGWDGG